MKNKRIKQLVVFHEKLEELWKHFQSLYYVIEAGGGVVKNDNNKTLFIFKYGKWDLPKGKVNDGEPVRDAALREVKEESGVNGLEITRELGVTHHLFHEGNSVVLKNTHWYEMKTHFNGELKADKNEGIEKAKWLDNAGMEEAFQNTYPSVIEMCKASLSGN